MDVLSGKCQQDLGSHSRMSQAARRAGRLIFGGTVEHVKVTVTLHTPPYLNVNISPSTTSTGWSSSIHKRKHNSIAHLQTHAVHTATNSSKLSLECPTQPAFSRYRSHRELAVRSLQDWPNRRAKRRTTIPQALERPSFREEVCLALGFFEPPSLQDRDR